VSGELSTGTFFIFGVKLNNIPFGKGYSFGFLEV